MTDHRMQHLYNAESTTEDEILDTVNKTKNEDTTSGLHTEIESSLNDV